MLIRKRKFGFFIPFLVSTAWFPTTDIATEIAKALLAMPVRNDNFYVEISDE